MIPIAVGHGAVYYGNAIAIDAVGGPGTADGFKPR